MNTQNVNTATKESSERWVENRLNYAISEQKSLLMRLEELKNMRMMADERAELVMGTLMRMADTRSGWWRIKLERHQLVSSLHNSLTPPRGVVVQPRKRGKASFPLFRGFNYFNNKRFS